MPFPNLEEVMRSTPELSKTDLEYFQEWMSKQPHFPRMEDIELVPFLVKCDYSLERTKEVLDKYLTMRTHAPEVFMYRELTAIKEQFKYFHISRAAVDAQGHHVVCIGFEKADASQGFNAEAYTYLALAIIELMVREKPATPGYVFICDAQNLTATHVARASLSLFKKFVSFIREAYPGKIITMHVINLNSIVDKVVLLLKPFLSGGFTTKMYYHSKNSEEFYKLVSKDTLPQDYGGSLPPSKADYDELVARLFEQEDWLRSLDRRVVDEGRRPGRAKGEGDVFGVDGSFKSLDFD